MKYKAYKFRFYPTEAQAELLIKTFGCVRFVYNKALEERKRLWEEEKRSSSWDEDCKRLTTWKNSEGTDWLREVSSDPPTQALAYLDSSYQNFFKKRTNFPRFKSKRYSRDSAKFTNQVLRFKDGQLYLPKMKESLNIVWDREILAESKILSATVSRDRSHRWFISISVEEEIQQLPKLETSVGVDLGLTHYATLSTVEKIENPHFERSEKRLKRAQQRFAKKQKDSKNREKARLKVAKIHAKIADQRRDFLHKLTTRLIRENQAIVIEDLAVKNMKKKSKSRSKRGLNRSISDASWAEFRRQLEYKADWYGRDLVVVDRFFPSSKLCSNCGFKNTKLQWERSWTCENCNEVHDRDFNAAKNLLAVGSAVLACGEDVRRSLDDSRTSEKQEILG